RVSSSSWTGVRADVSRPASRVRHSAADSLRRRLKSTITSAPSLRAAPERRTASVLRRVTGAARAPLVWVACPRFCVAMAELAPSSAWPRKAVAMPPPDRVPLRRCGGPDTLAGWEDRHEPATAGRRRPRRGEIVHLARRAGTHAGAQRRRLLPAQ